MVKKFMLTATLVAVTTTTAFASDMTIRWGTEAGYKPFMFKSEAGDLVGFDYEIGNAICEVLKAECSWTEQAWDGMIPALNAQKYDAILASMSITKERQRAVDFTGKYYHVPYRFVGSTDANLSVESLSGKVVGVQIGTTSQVFLERAMKDVEIKTYPTQDEVWLDLAVGRIDAGLGNMIVVEDSFLSTNYGEGFEMFGPEYSDAEYFGLGTGIAVRKSDGELRDAITDAIATLRKNGKYKEINDKYFPFDIYGK